MNATTVSPVWTDGVTMPRFGAPNENLTVDVIVIGGGITGLTAGYLLKEAGFTVALLERDRIAGVDSGHTTAHVTRVTDRRLHEIAKMFGDDVARAVWDVGGAAIDQIAALVRNENIACGFHWVPGYLHAPLGADAEGTERASRDLRDEKATADRLAIAATLLSRIPGLGVPGLRFPHQALFHPTRYLAALATRIDGDGSHVFEHANADEVLEKPLRVKSGGVEISGGYLVLATHNPLVGHASMVGATLFQTKLSLYSSYALGARVRAGQFPEASFWDTSDPYYYLRVDRRDGHDFAIFGGEDHKTGQEPDTRAVYDRLEAKFRSFAPEAEVSHHWSGQVIETHDGLPYIGEATEKQFIATGFSGNGMTFGTLAGLMAVDAVTKRKNPWRDLFDPHRKKLVGGTWSYLTENKDYPYYLVRNWLAGSEGRSLDVLNNGEGRILNLDGRKVAAYRDEQGQVSLCSPVCTHLQCIVAWNNAERTWDCPCHGSRFKPTGEVISGPAEEPLAPVELAGKKTE